MPNLVVVVDNPNPQSTEIKPIDLYLKKPTDMSQMEMWRSLRELYKQRDREAKHLTNPAAGAVYRMICERISELDKVVRSLP